MESKMKKSEMLKHVSEGDIVVVRHETGKHPFGVQLVRVASVGCTTFMTGNAVVYALNSIVGVVNPSMDQWALTEIPEDYLKDKAGGCMINMERKA